MKSCCPASCAAQWVGASSSTTSQVVTHLAVSWQVCCHPAPTHTADHITALLACVDCVLEQHKPTRCHDLHPDPHDLQTRTWPRYSKAVPSLQFASMNCINGRLYLDLCLMKPTDSICGTFNVAVPYCLSVSCFVFTLLLPWWRLSLMQ